MNKCFNLAAAFLAAFLLSNCQAQNAAPAAGDEAALIKGFDAVWAAYEKGDEATMWAAYADDACEVYPDGSSACGLAAIKAGFAEFGKMLDAKPSWKYTRPTVKFLDPNVALLISEVTSDIRMGGQQIGGKTKFVAILKKSGDRWLIAYDGQTPVLPPPPGMTGQK